MIIEINRIEKGLESTLARLVVDGKVTGYVLEDEDRGLTSAMPLATIAKIKIYGRTAIPTGRYRVKMTDSKKFGKFMPEILSVPGYGGVRIHKGNYIANTLGCILPGARFDKDALGYYRVWDSGKIFDPLLARIIAADARKEEIWCSVTSDYA